MIEMNRLFDGYYASRCGQIFSKKSKKFLSQTENKRGYLTVKISIKGKAKTHLVHRLVAMAFLGKSDLTVDHVDGNKKNNSVDNLRYLTALENHAKAVSEGKIKSGLEHYSSKLTADQVKKIRISEGKQSEIARRFKINQSMVSRIKRLETYSNV